MAEHKYIDLKALKVSDDGSGTIEGYRSVFGEIDEGGDIIVKGAFADCIPEYLSAGFTAESHDWDFSKAVGYPIEAKEDEHGWFVKSQFHSTPDAQSVRTKAQERFKAGKKVGFSFGYRTDDYQVIQSKDFKDQLPQYIKPERLNENMEKAQQFSEIRILKKVSAIEDSLVTSPMNKMASATGVKSEDDPNLKEIPGTDSFESFESAGTALEKFAQKMRSNHEIRTKEGRVLSSSNRAKVTACKESLTALIADLNDLLTLSEPKPKEKEMDVEALRTQWQRLEGQVLATLSR